MPPSQPIDSQEQGFAGAVKAPSLEDACVNQSAEPAVAAEWIGVVVEAANCREDPGVVETPLLDLVVWSFDVGAEAAEIFAKSLLYAIEPGVLRIVASVDAALLD